MSEGAGTLDDATIGDEVESDEVVVRGLVDLYKKHLRFRPVEAKDFLEDLLGKDTPTSNRLRQVCDKMGFQYWRFLRVDSDYYDWSLERRRETLGAPDVSFLCKSLIMQNTKCEHNDFSDPTNSKYYVIIVQYVAKLHKECLIKVVQRAGGNKLGKRSYNFRIVPEETSFQLCGFDHNAVSPIGMKEKIPIILDEPISKLPFFWLGGGEVDVKWAVPVEEFLQKFSPIVGQITR